MNQKLNLVLTKVKSVLNSFWVKVTSDVNSLWEQDKAFVIAFGLIILAVKFREVLINLLVASGKAIFQNAETKNTKLADQEDSDDLSANTLIKQANSLPNSEKPVDDYWNKK
jgi:cbb3-type cytochrome oxidase subunit 3